MNMTHFALMIASAGVTLGKDVRLFFTFFGMDAINKTKYGPSEVAPVGSPAMPSRTPFLPLLSATERR
jgi:peroxiredoxin family protein